MALPTQADLLGFEWGFGGAPFVDLAAKSTLDPGFAEWSLGGVPLLFNLDSSDDAADRAVTALNALVLMGNPSTADAIVTVLRKMVLRTQDAPAADRRVTNLIARVLRATRRGDVAKPGVWSRVAFADVLPAPLRSIYGYTTVGSATMGNFGSDKQSLLGFPNSPARSGTDFDTWGGEASPVSPLNSFSGNQAAVVSAFVNAFPAGQTFKSGVGLGTSTLSWSGNASTISVLPVGTLWGCVQAIQPGWFGGVIPHQGLGAVNADYSLKASTAFAGEQIAYWAPAVDTQAVTGSLIHCPTTTLFRLFSQQFVGGPTITDSQNLVGVNLPGAPDEDVVASKICPTVNLVRRMGQGRYRVVPGTYRGYFSATALAPLPAPDIPSGPLEALYGVEFDTPEDLIQALNTATPGLSTSFSSPLPDTHYASGYTLEHEVQQLGWGPSWENYAPTVDSVDIRFLVRDDGAYVSADGVVRFRRRKTLTLGLALGLRRIVEDPSYTPEETALTRGCPMESALMPAVDLSWSSPTSYQVALGALDVLPLDNGAELADLVGRITGAGINLAFPDNSQFALLTSVVIDWATDYGYLSYIPAFEAALADDGPRGVQVGGLVQRAKNTGLYWASSPGGTRDQSYAVFPPCIVVEKLDSPSTHITDDLDTPGTDNNPT